MERDKALDKIRKLMAKANDPCNVHEAAAAAEAAQRLMLLHKIEEAELAGVETPDDEPITDMDLLADSRQVAPTSWQQILLGAIARSCFCRLIVTRSAAGVKGRLQVFGRRSDLDAVAYLYRAVSNQINALCDAWGRVYDVTRGDRNGFRYGAAVTISNRMQQARQAQEREIGSTALVPIRKADAAVDSHIEERFRTLRTVQHRGPSSLGGYVAGRHAGEHISVGGARGGLGQGASSLPA